MINAVSSSRWLGWCASLAIAVSLALSPLAARAAPAALSAEDRQEIAVEAYLYAYPAVLMEKTRRLMTNVYPGANPMAAPMNQFSHMKTLRDDKFEWVTVPNADTLYSSLWYDVSKEPLIVSAPDSGGRFYMLPFLDMWTNVVAAPGVRTTGGGSDTFAIVGPNWRGALPAGVRAYRSPTPVGWMIGRFLVYGKADLPKAQDLQAKVTVRPLSGWGKADYVAPAGEGRAPGKFIPPTNEVAMMDPAAYFRLFSEVTAKNAPLANDYPLLDRLARLGLTPGRPFDLNSQPPEVQEAFRKAPALAMQRVLYAATHQGLAHGGWRSFLNPMGTYGTDYLRRALVAYVAVGANDVEDAAYSIALTDSDGRLLDSGGKYVVHFDKAQMPPARAFWSVAMYDDRHLLTANPINRFALGDRDRLTFNPDGSLDLYIQLAAPDADKAANWLPTPAQGGFLMIMRLYWASQSVLNGNWTPPAIKRVD